MTLWPLAQNALLFIPFVNSFYCLCSSVEYSCAELGLQMALVSPSWFVSILTFDLALQREVRPRVYMHKQSCLYVLRGWCGTIRGRKPWDRGEAGHSMYHIVWLSVCAQCHPVQTFGCIPSFGCWENIEHLHWCIGRAAWVSSVTMRHWVNYCAYCEIHRNGHIRQETQWTTEPMLSYNTVRGKTNVS